MKNLKFFLLIMILGLFAPMSYSQDDVTVDEVETVDETSATTDAVVSTGETPDPSDTSAFIEWWGGIVGLLNVLIIWIVGKIWPTDKGSVMKTRAVQIGLGVIVLVILFLTTRGDVPLNFQTVISGVIAYVVQELTYKGVAKPLGGATPRAEVYNKTA